MRNSVQRHAILLAALLQILPIVRNFFANPAATSSFAFILRWGVGTVATVATYDAYSAASPYFSPITNWTGSVGSFMSNSVVVTNLQSFDSGGYFIIYSQPFAVSPHVGNGVSITNGMPPGLVFKCIDLNNGSTAKPFYGAIFGTPTTPVTNLFIHYQAGNSNASGNAIDVTNFITILPALTASPPVITNQPSSLTNLVSSNATFTVTAGTAPLRYQWYFNTNTALGSMTNTSLSLTNIQLADAGYYRVIITNSSGAVTSSSALLTIWQPPNITNQPVNFTNIAGGGANFTVVAGGVPAVNYQWRLNPNTPQTGATAATLNFANIRANQAGSYSVVITNAAGSVTSSPAALVVTNPLPPGITLPPTGGGQFQFAFKGVAGLTNTVLTNGSLVGGSWGVLTNIPPPANNNPITLTNATGLPSLFYRVVVTP